MGTVMQTNKWSSIVLRLILAVFIALNTLLPASVEAKNKIPSSNKQQMGLEVNDPFGFLVTARENPKDAQVLKSVNKQIDVPVLILEATPKSLKPNGKVDIAWVIDGLTRSDLQRSYALALDTGGFYARQE